jgi:tRNA G18 (ribose-2'-O)-methylase SpoU
VIIAATEAALKLEIIEDPADPRIVDYRDARADAERRTAGLFLTEGRLVVRRLLESSRFRTRSVLLTDRSLHTLRDAIGERGTGVYVASAAVIRSIVGFKFHRGCLALGEREPAGRVEAVAAPGGPRVLLALEDLADPDNIGAVFRNGAAFGVAGVLLSRACADPLYRKAIRVSMGATLSIPFVQTAWPAGLDALRAAGYMLVALTPDRGAEAIARVAERGPCSRRLALLVGSEGAGLSDRTRASADLCVRIPMAPGVDSLNVAAATGIALHRLATGIMGEGRP